MESLDEASLPYRSLPKVMRMYYQWNLSGLRTCFICGAEEQDRIFAVELHTGRSLSGPLGGRTGYHIYNGPTTKDPLLAAVGDESPLGSYSLNNNSTVLFPQIKTNQLVEEFMRARVLPKPDKTIAYRFAVDVRVDGKTRRETFEWVKVNNHNSDSSSTGSTDAKNGDFKLLWLVEGGDVDSAAGAMVENGDGGGGSSTAKPAYDSRPGGKERVGVLSWSRFFSSPKSPFTLTFTGSEEFERLGDRCALMALVTAIRLWALHSLGKTHRAPVAVAEKIGQKDRTV